MVGDVDTATVSRLIGGGLEIQDLMQNAELSRTI